MRRRIRLRTTAPPRAFFTLAPKRLCAAPFGRKKMTNCELVRRRPLRYTASNSGRWSRRTARGKRRALLLMAAALEPSDRREAMTSLLSPRGQHAAPSYGLHTRAEAVCFVAPPNSWLKSALGHRNSPLVSLSGGNSNVLVYAVDEMGSRKGGHG